MSAFAGLIGKDFSSQTDIIPFLFRTARGGLTINQTREVNATEELLGLLIPEAAET